MVLRNEQGFTLIEILAAFMVFAVVAVPLIQILLQGNQLAHKAAYKTIAVNIAQQEMEELIAQGSVKTEEEGTFETGNRKYLGTVSLASYFDLVLVTVSVTYESADTEDKVEFSTILPKED